MATIEELQIEIQAALKAPQSENLATLDKLKAKLLISGFSFEAGL